MPMIGTSLVLQSKFADRNSVPTDPGAVSGWVIQPDSSLVAVNPSPTIEVGTWEVTFLPTQTGRHIWRVASSDGLTVAAERAFLVEASKVLL